MKTRSIAPSVTLSPLNLAWLGLVLLTLLSLCLGRWTHGGPWLQLPVAAIVWLKGWIVARHFLETHLAHPFIALVVRVFLACVPLALLLTAWLGEHLVT